MHGEEHSYSILVTPWTREIDCIMCHPIGTIMNLIPPDFHQIARMFTHQKSEQATALTRELLPMNL